MTHAELLALTQALYPFAPDEQNEMNETEGMYAEAMQVISQALPDIYYAALETAWAGQDANQLVVNLLQSQGFIVDDCVSEAAWGVRCEFQGSYFNGLHYLDTDELADAMAQDGIDFAVLEQIWQAARLDGGDREHKRRRLAQLLRDLTGEPQVDAGLTRTADPPTDRQCLGWLLTGAFGLTGNPYLDYGQLEIDLNNVEPPIWDAAEVEYALERLAEVQAVGARIHRGWELFHAHRDAILAKITQAMTSKEEIDAAAWPV
ncbi:MAG: hypothetical protein ACKO9F_01430 [Caldilinea sp.]